jgi:putative ABC transport system permease protein
MVRAMTGREKTKAKTSYFKQEYYARIDPNIGIEDFRRKKFQYPMQRVIPPILSLPHRLKMMGTGSAIGKKIYDGTHSFEVIGVTNDFVYGDMYGQSDPVIFYTNPKASKIFIHTHETTSRSKNALAKLETILRKTIPPTLLNTHL